jgi:GTPase SAR1 family protein
VEATAENFLKWIEKTLSPFQTRRDVLETVAPSLLAMLEAGQEPLAGWQKRRLERFYECFEPVHTVLPQASHRKLYLLGASPDWQDLAHQLDAPRLITTDIEDAIRTSYAHSDKSSCIAVTGSAGCGKSTIVRRVALSLVAEGYPIFFSNSEDLPKTQELTTALDLFSRRAILVLDNADLALRWLALIYSELNKLERPPVIVIAARTNRFDRHSDALQQQTEIREMTIPHLVATEIDALLAVLEMHNLLGRLRGMTLDQRRAEFEVRAQKQILVAMKEATEGPGFNEIIANEFEEITPQEAKILYLCAAIPTASGFRISRQQLLGCAEAPPSLALDLMARNLKDIIIPQSDQPDWLRVRHPLIAEHILDVVAPRGLLREAYIRLLKVLANDLGRQPDTHPRIFKMYRKIVNHSGIYNRFLKNIADARAIFDSIQNWFRSDPHFWLQFGSLELEYGELAFAGNYIHQAESLAPNDDFIVTTKGHLVLKRAVNAVGLAEAMTLWAEGQEIILNQISRRGKFDAHPYHIFGSQTLAMVNRWITDRDEKKDRLYRAQTIVGDGVKLHPRNRDLKQLLADITRSYLSLAIPGE